MFQKLSFNHDLDGIKLVGFRDADYGGDIDSRRSTFGYCFSVQSNSAIVSWRTNCRTVALSTAESELNAATAGATEAVYLTGILADLGYPQPPPIKLYCNNKAAIAMSRNPVQHAKAKHFLIKLHYIRN